MPLETGVLEVLLRKAEYGKKFCEKAANSCERQSEILHHRSWPVNGWAQMKVTEFVEDTG